MSRNRKPSPHPTAPPVEPFRPWRIDFTRPDVVEYPAAESPDSPTIARRLLLLLGLAYLFLTALTSGLAYTGYFAAASTDKDDSGDDDREEQPEDMLPPQPPPRHPNAPGLHIRPDGSRYLIMPLPSDLADRLRGQAPAIGGGTA